LLEDVTCQQTQVRFVGQQSHEQPGNESSVFELSSERGGLGLAPEDLGVPALEFGLGQRQQLTAHEFADLAPTMLK
jgi:hypothetical protein